jgi:hypothetical protein
MTVGHVIDEPDVDSQTAARLGGLDFDVKLYPAGFRVGDALDAETGELPGVLPQGEIAKLADEVGKAPNAEAMRKFGRRVPELLAHIAALSGHTATDARWVAFHGRNAVVNETTQMPYDVVSGDYVPVQFSEAFTFMDAVNPRYVAAGTLKGGRQGFMVAQLSELTSLQLDGLGPDGDSDPHDMFAVLRTSHDRSRGLEVALMGLRQRCMNSLGLRSFTRGAPQRWSIRHVGDVASKLQAAQQVITNMTNYAAEYERMARRLAETEVLLSDAEEILTHALEDRPTRETTVNSIISAWNLSPYVGFKNTGWGLTQAVSEYFEWGRDTNVRTDQSRFLGVLEGSTAKAVNRVAQLVMTR